MLSIGIFQIKAPFFSRPSINEKPSSRSTRTIINSISDGNIKRMKRARVATAIPAEVISALAKMQDGLNKFIDVDWRLKRSPNDWCLAVTIEATELMDSYPWKWWKNVKATPDFNNVRVELVDILHFALSGTMQMQSASTSDAAAAAVPALPADVETVITSPLSETQNAVKTFLNVIYLAKHHKFDAITSMVIASADDLEFNLVGYYVAKHTLNYIRQLGGYKDGSYVKVQQGMEDNELLHSCIAAVSVAECLGSDGAAEDGAAAADFQPAWDKIMSAVFDAFKVSDAERRTAASWLA